jgi:hypothetical protein
MVDKEEIKISKSLKEPDFRLSYFFLPLTLQIKAENAIRH